MATSKTVSLDELITIRNHLRVNGQTVVLTNGCFDILHVGHVRYLAQARALGDCLIVGLNSDASMREIKGEKRPLVPQNDRAEILAALTCVDYVVIFEEDTAEELVTQLKPDIYAKGGDYAISAELDATPTASTARESNTADQPNPGATAKDLPEARIVGTYGGKVAILPLYDGRSTADLVKVVLERYSGR